MVKLIVPLLLGFLVFVSGFAQADDSNSDEALIAPPPRTGALQVGDVAPDFTLPTIGGENVTLSEYRGKKKVVLYFYPKDKTPGCTQEAKQFQEDLSRIEKTGAVVLGVSVDNVKSHKAFADDLELKFPLLADSGGKVARQYGAMGWIMAKRVTYIIGEDGKIKEVFPEVNVTDHSKAVLHALQAIAKSNATQN